MLIECFLQFGYLKIDIFIKNAIRLSPVMLRLFMTQMEQIKKADGHTLAVK